MITPNPKSAQISELLFKNPRKRMSDNIPRKLKVFIKEKVSRTLHHHLIIPATKNHTSWTLGAQPGWDSISELRNVEGKGTKKIHIVSMLADRERAIDLESSDTITVSRLPWFDHGTLSLITSKNQTATTMHKFQEDLYNEFDQIQNKQESIFYCHCMAGISRSFIETMAFIHYHPNKEQLFDFNEPGWNKIRDKIPLVLQKRLQSDPSFSDIAKFVEIQRPKVKPFAKLDSDQAGILGLMALDQSVKKPEIIQTRELTRLYEDAQNIGLALKAPLDSSFRDPEDRKDQENNLIETYKAYKKRNINLLIAMVLPTDGTVGHKSQEGEFKFYFDELKPSEQAHFAIMLQKLEQQLDLDLGLLRGKSSEYAKVAVKNVKKLTAGDQIELLKTFGSMLKLDYQDIVKKTLKGNGIDRHNTGIKLAELLHITPIGDHFIEKIISNNKLSDAERFSFITKLQELHDDRADKYAQLLLDK